MVKELIPPSFHCRGTVAAAEVFPAKLAAHTPVSSKVKAIEQLRGKITNL